MKFVLVLKLYRNLINVQLNNTKITLRFIDPVFISTISIDGSELYYRRINGFDCNIFFLTRLIRIDEISKSIRDVWIHQLSHILCCIILISNYIPSIITLVQTVKAPQVINQHFQKLVKKILMFFLFFQGIHFAYREHSIMSPLLLINIFFVYFRAYIYGVSKKSALSVITLASPRANTPFTVVLAAAPKTPLLPREVRIPKSTFIIFTVKTPQPN